MDIEDLTIEQARELILSIKENLEEKITKTYKTLLIIDSSIKNGNVEYKSLALANAKRLLKGFIDEAILKI